jgi:hypothetical protein
MTMAHIGQSLLAALALASALGTYRADFDKHHVFNPSWSPHARFHAAAYALLNIGVALASFWLCLWLPFGWQSSIKMASGLLVLMGSILFLSSLIPGTSPVAGPHEKIWRKVPLALWINVGYLVVLAIASWCALQG